MRKNYVLIFFLLISINSLSQGKNEFDIDEIEKKFLLKKAGKPAKYISLLDQLTNDNLISSYHILLKNIVFFKSHDKNQYKKEYDVVIEQWIVDEEDIPIVKQFLIEINNDSYYEKPPKVYISKGNKVLVISSWGAFYRNKLYEIADYLIIKHGFLLIE
jgi:hypothetical protein